MNNIDTLLLKRLREALLSSKSTDLSLLRNYYLRLLAEYFDNHSITLSALSDEADRILWGYIKDPAKAAHYDLDFQSSLFLVSDLSYYILKSTENIEAQNRLNSFIEATHRYYLSNKHIIAGK